MNIQDRRKTLTVEELRRRYNLDSLDKDRKAIKMAKEQLNKVDSELNDFVKATTENLKELQDQVDGNITTWFFNGVPTLENEPANEWTTDEEKINHLGDLYYDQDTGYAYRWAVENNIYSWSKIVDADVVKALAVANSAQDTADSKRRIFVTNPIPPYDVGDIWIKDDQDLYRCRASRENGKMNNADWIIATKYTDDTVALETKAELNQFKTEVTENYVTNATLETTAGSITGRVEETYTYVTKVEHQVNDITTTTQTSIGGNNLYLKEALESNALEYSIDGKCEQETSVQGKNLFDIIGQFKKLYGTSVTVNSTVFTLLENGKINIKGTPTKRTQLAITTGSATSKDIIVPLDSTKTYTFSTNFNQKSISLYYLDTTDTIKPIYMNGATTKSISNAKGIVYINIDIQTLIAYDTDYYFQIEQGTATTYEPFVPNSPSPDYPSEIKTIKGIRNLLNLNAPTSTTNGITCTNNNDGSITINGHTTAGFAYYLTNDNITFEKGKKYTISAKILSGSCTNYISSTSWAFRFIADINNVNATVTDIGSTTKEVEKTFDGSNASAKPYLWFGWTSSTTENDAVFNDLRVQFMVEEGDIKHSFVPYGTYEKVKVTGKNLFDKDNTYTAIGEVSGYVSSDYIPVKKGDTINKTNSVMFWFYDKSKNQIGFASGSTTTTVSLDNVAYVRCNVLKTDLDTFMLTINQEPTEYEPYKEKEVLIDLAKENLFDKDNVSFGSVDNTTGVLKQNGISSHSITNDTISFIATANYRGIVSDYISVDSLTNYVLNCVSDYSSMFYIVYNYDNEFNFLGYSTGKSSVPYSFTTLKNTQYIRSVIEVSTYKANTTVNVSNIKIYKGTNADDSYELNSIGDIKDKLEIVNGVVVIQKRIGKVVLDGTQTIISTVNRTNTTRFVFGNLINNMVRKGYCYDTMSSHFVAKNVYSIDQEGYFIHYPSSDEFSRIYLSVPNEIATTKEQMNTFLNNNKISIYYPLDEPKQIILPNVQIPLFDGVNHISLVDDLETTTSIKYYRNTPIAQDYVVQQQLDATNANLSNTDNKVSQAQSDINTTNTNLNNNYYNKEQIDVMNTSTEKIITQIKNSVETTTNATNLQISILQEQLKNGVTQVVTETGYRFDKDGLLIQKTGSEMSSLLDNDGLVVKRNTTEVLTVRSSGVETENLKVRTYFTIGTNTRVENYKNGTGFFYVGGAN